MLLIEHPSTRWPEREYVFKVVFDELLGVEYEQHPMERQDVRITHTARAGGVRVGDSLLSAPVDEWLTPSSLPKEPLARVQTEQNVLSMDNHQLPVLYRATTAPEFTSDSTTDIDIFGSIFYLLTRYEEVTSPIFDRHGRFPASESLLAREKLLHRPIVDEYVDLLWALLSRQFPCLERKPKKYKANLTFDIDWPLLTYGVSLPKIARACAADIAKRKEPSLAVRRLASYAHIRLGHVEQDAGNIFDRIMSACEVNDVQATFYVIAGEGVGDVNGSYTLDMPFIRRLLWTIHSRGHQIGLHPTYDSYLSMEKLELEFCKLRKAAEDLGIYQSSWGARQHYLQWQAPTTWRHYSNVGITYDSSLGFADRPGFRCGTAHEFSTFDLQQRKVLQVTERPLLAMDANLFGERKKYGMRLDAASAAHAMLELDTQCRVHGGAFTTVWHNNWLVRSDVWSSFKQVAKQIGGSNAKLPSYPPNREGTTSWRH